MISEILVFLAIFLLSIALFGSVFRKKTSSLNHPPSIPSIPLLGSLPFIIRGVGHLSKFFMKKSEELGPIFTLKMGNRLCLVLNSFEAIEDALVKKSSTFSGRQIFFQETYCRNELRKGIIPGNFNAFWKYHQKLSLSILREFGFGNNNIMENRISQEVTELVNALKQANGRPFDPKDLTMRASANIIHQILFANRIPFNNGRKTLYDFIAEFAVTFSLMISIAPWLRFFPYFRNKAQDSLRCHDEIWRLIKEYVYEVMSGDRESCFVSKYIEKEGLNCDYEQLFFIIRDLAAAGSDTTATTTQWSLLFLANHPEIQKKLQMNIDEVVPRSRLPCWADKQRLPYVEAFILEVLRMKTLLPFSLPHQTLNDICVSGCYVPAGTMVMPNLYAVHMDRKFWKDPEDFRPERFLDESNAIVNKERCIPFSLGRRSCLGEVLARQELFQIISGLVQNFDVHPTEDQQIIVCKETCEVFLKPPKFQVRMNYRSK